MKRFFAVAMLCSVLCVGCQFYDTGKKVEGGAQKVAAATDAVTGAVGQIDPAWDAIEEVTGESLDPATIGKIENFANRINKYSRNTQKGAAIGAAVPGPQQPWVATLGIIAGALTGLSGAVAGLMERRRKKATEKALKVMIKVTEPAEKIGAKIHAAAVKAGVADVIEKQYQEVV